MELTKSIEMSQAGGLVREFAKKILRLSEDESVGYELVPFLTQLFPDCRPGWYGRDDRIHLDPGPSEEEEK